MNIYKTRLENLQTRSEQMKGYEQILNLPSSRFSNIKNISEDLHCKLLLWNTSQEWQSYLLKLNQTEFMEINVEEVQTIAETFIKNVNKCKKRIPLSNEKLFRLDKNTKDFSSVLPVIVALKNPLLKASHFKEINSIIGFNVNGDGIKLKKLLCKNVLDNQKQIIEVSVQVFQEEQLKKELVKIDEKISTLQFPLKVFKEENAKDLTYILDDCTKLMTEIEKLTQMINAVYGSRYLKDLKTAATNKRKDILLIQETLNAWIKFQKHYIYLESIFSQNEIKKPLQMEAKEFEESVNKHYKSNVKKVVANQSMTQIIKQKILDLLYNSFQKQNHTLSELNKKINNFLDSKREFFPRFYFIPNEELIYILANYDNPAAFQTFIGKLFQNVNK